MRKNRKMQFAITLVKMAATGIAGGIALISSAKRIGEMISDKNIEEIAEEKKHED